MSIEHWYLKVVLLLEALTHESSEFSAGEDDVVVFSDVMLEVVRVSLKEAVIDARDDQYLRLLLFLLLLISAFGDRDCGQLGLLTLYLEKSVRPLGELLGQQQSVVEGQKPHILALDFHHGAKRIIGHWGKVRGVLHK